MRGLNVTTRPSRSLTAHQGGGTETTSLKELCRWSPLISNTASVNGRHLTYEQRALTEHVRTILAAPDDPAAVAKHEQAINEIIYRLYGVTSDEIAIMENKR